MKDINYQLLLQMDVALLRKEAEEALLDSPFKGDVQLAHDLLVLPISHS